MAVRIVTDSSAGLPSDIVRDLDITVVDLHILETEGEQSTSGLTALELAAAYARQLERGGDEGVVALHLSKELSSTWSAAVAASAVFDEKVVVIDTSTVGMAIGAAAMAAASIAKDGASFADCVALAKATLERSETWLYLHRVEEMRRSGRISTTTAMWSTTLATKPIMHLVDGRIELALKTRTQSRAFLKLVEVISKRAGDKPAFVAIQHNQALEAARTLEEQLRENLAAGSSLMITEMEKTLAIHSGAGAVGVSAVFQELDTESKA
ncbi:DegV family protein [Corynebacterium kutscheri]|uniref:DegV family protein n=1 Tax=Corynebacterium kutscheri TaxID=35755 RepID=A0A0F6QZ37_9CORY|nr:DegV family protein [Corynebacterium kutscheri]AKE40912.1 EDD domain protein, DegV family [Corynebacterium kutscheri]VEH06711.1 DegV family protein [Corynebacterium kutscheri]VEH09211.1 DegV family protein [Corynebacterium kutscheri]VEH79297.1 DegV family protein [Corynebacterium kutscheri]